MHEPITRSVKSVIYHTPHRYPGAVPVSEISEVSDFPSLSISIPFNTITTNHEARLRA
jgi:hypothetical protein